MAVELTQNDISDLKSQGYSDQEIQQAINEIEKEDLNDSYGATQQRQGVDPRNNSQHSAFASRPTEDIIRWQLELNDILERAEHILRGDIVKFKDGHLIWEKNPNPELNPLNEFGVQEVMRVLAMYINRNTILSDYEKEEINYKVFDFGRALSNLIFMRYEEMGLDNEEKRKEYEMLVRQMVDIVHSSYKRALMGGERRSLREMISVQQSHSSTGQMQGGQMINGNDGSRQRGMLNPMRYIKGKYV